MSKDIKIKKIDGSQKRLKGLKDKGRVDFDCTKCNIPLLVIQRTSLISGTPKIEVLTRIVVKCGFCNRGYSLVEQINGMFYPGAPNDKTIFEPIEGDKDTPEADVCFRSRSK